MNKLAAAFLAAGGLACGHDRACAGLARAEPSAQAPVACSVAVGQRHHWHDPTGQAGREQALQAPWVPAGRWLSEGFGDGAHWLALGIDCPLPGAVLRLQVPYLDRIEVHQKRADGRWELALRGDTVPAPASGGWATPRVALLEPRDPQAPVLLRVQTSSTALIRAEPMPSAAADRLDALESLGLGLHAGLMLALLGLAAVRVHARQRGLFAAFALYECTGLAMVLALMGQLGLLWPSLVPWQHAIGSLGVLLSSVVGVWFFDRLLQPLHPAGSPHRWLASMLRLLGLVMLACIPAWLLGWQRQALQALHWAMSLGVLWCLLVVLWPQREPVAQRRLHRWVFGLLGASVALTVGRNLGAWAWGVPGPYSAVQHFATTGLAMFLLLMAHDAQERQRQRALRRALQAQRTLAQRRNAALAAKAQVVAMLSHELQSPVTALEFALNADAPADVATARRALADLRQVVERGQQFDRLEGEPAGDDPPPQTLALLPWLRELLAQWKPPVDGGQAPVLLQGPEDARLSTDPLLLRMVLLNLLNNAVQHGRPPLRLSVVAAARPPDEGRGSAAEGQGLPAQRLPTDGQGAPAATPALGLSLRLSNTLGVAGRPPAHALFERYHRPPSSAPARMASSGQGTGLWLSRLLAERLQGALRLLPATHEQGQEITFELWLPASPNPHP